MIDSVQSFFLEHAWRLFLSLGAIQFLLICLWSWRRTTRTKRAVWIGFVLIPTLVGLSAAVTTTREQIIELCRELARYVEDGNATAIALRLSEDFEAEGLDRAAFEQRLIEAFKRYRIDRPRLSRFEIALPSDDRAVAEFDAACFVRTDQVLANSVLTRWRVFFREDNDRWRLTQVQAVPAPFSPLRSLGQWLD